MESKNTTSDASTFNMQQLTSNHTPTNEYIRIHNSLQESTLNSNMVYSTPAQRAMQELRSGGPTIFDISRAIFKICTNEFGVNEE